MDWKEEIVNSIQAKERVRKLITNVINESVTELTKAFNDKTLRYDIRVVDSNVLRVAGNSTVKLTADWISEETRIPMEELTEEDIKNKIHEEILNVI